MDLKIITHDLCSTRHDVHIRMLALFSEEITKGPGGAAEVFLFCLRIVSPMSASKAIISKHL